MWCASCVLDSGRSGNTSALWSGRLGWLKKKIYIYKSCPCAGVGRDLLSCTKMSAGRIFKTLLQPTHPSWRQTGQQIPQNCTKIRTSHNLCGSEDARSIKYLCDIFYRCSTHNKVIDQMCHFDHTVYSVCMHLKCLSTLSLWANCPFKNPSTDFSDMTSILFFYVNGGGNSG